MKENFKPDNNWNSHLPLLYAALEATTGLVVEFGVGAGSTPALHEYCKAKGRKLESYENNLEWLNKFKHLESDFHKLHFISDWDNVNVVPSLLFVDHAPGTRRKVDIARYSDIAGIVLAHDTELPANYGYKMRDEFYRFKFVKDYIHPGLQAGATALSNFIDVTDFEL